MKTTLPASRNLFKTKAFACKLRLFVLAILFCFYHNLTFAQAPAISYSGPQTYHVGTAITLTPTVTGGAAQAYNGAVAYGSGINEPFSIAADAAGNIYVVDYSTQLVKEIPAGNGAPVTIGSGFSIPYGVAADAAGNVYVADEGNNSVKKIPAGNGAPVTIGSGFSFAFGVAVDAPGNVYVTDASANSVIKIPAGGGAPVTLGSGFSQPTGIAVDAGGNVYVADHGNSRVAKIPAGGGPTITVGSGFSGPVGVAIDAAGNLYVADTNNNAIKEVPSGGGLPVIVASGFGSLYCVAIDGKGNLYVGSGAAFGVRKLPPAGGYYLSTALPAGLSFNSNTGVISGTPTAESPATDYTIIAYNSAGSSTAVVNIKVNSPAPTISYGSPQIYSPGTAIAPLASTAAGVAAQAYNSIPVTLGSGFSQPTSVAVDAPGNVYVADYANFQVKKIPVGGGAPVTWGSGFTTPFAVAADAAGNVYVADVAIGLIKKIPAGNGAVVTISSASLQPEGVAIDSAGNIYASDVHNYAVIKIPSGNGAPVNLSSSLFYQPIGVAVDGAGNVYVADFGNGLAVNGSVNEIPAGNGSPVTLGSGLMHPTGVAVDAIGNVFAVGYGSNALMEIPAGNGAPVEIGSGFYAPRGVGVDGAGNIYVADYGNNAVKEVTPAGGYYISPALPPGLSFNSNTGVISGTPTVAGPATNYTITAYNSGGGSAATVSIQIASSNANLTNLTLNHGAALTPAFSAGQQSYTSTVPYSTNEISITPACDTTATIKVNNTAVTSGIHSPKFPLNVGTNTLTVVVKAQDGTTTKTYTVTVIRAASPNAYLSNLRLNGQTMSPAFIYTTTGYTAHVPHLTATVSVTPTSADAAATIKVNNVAVASHASSAPLTLNIGDNTIDVTVTAADGVSTKTYTITVTRAAAPADANLSNLRITGQTMSPAFTYTTTAYTSNVSNATSSVNVIPTPHDAAATVTVNGKAFSKSAPASPVALNVGDNIITTVVTAADGITTKTYTITVTRAIGSIAEPLAAIAVEKPVESPRIEGDDIVVHQAISPNGDGMNDHLVIDGITNYPDNKLMIMNRSGQLIYEAKGYDNSSRVFDGHSNKTGEKQLPGTYFYSLDYTLKGVTKHKTGFIVLKY